MSETHCNSSLNSKYALIKLISAIPVKEGHCKVQYRVGLAVWQLGWVDIGSYNCALILSLLGLKVVRLNWQSICAKWGNFPFQVNQTHCQTIRSTLYRISNHTSLSLHFSPFLGLMVRASVAVGKMDENGPSISGFRWDVASDEHGTAFGKKIQFWQNGSLSENETLSDKTLWGKKAWKGQLQQSL